MFPSSLLLPPCFEDVDKVENLFIGKGEGRKDADEMEKAMEARGMLRKAKGVLRKARRMLMSLRSTLRKAKWGDELKEGEEFQNESKKDAEEGERDLDDAHKDACEAEKDADDCVK